MSGTHAERLTRLGRLIETPVMAIVRDRATLHLFLKSHSPVCIIGQVDLVTAGQLISEIRKDSDKLVLLNIDTTGGLAKDREGVEYLSRLGADGLVTTRGSLLAYAARAEMLTMQKLFITDTMTLRRAVESVQGAKPDLLQAMPAPVLSLVKDHPLMKIRPVIAGGFITDDAGVKAALDNGAVGVSVSTTALWNYRR